METVNGVRHTHTGGETITDVIDSVPDDPAKLREQLRELDDQLAVFPKKISSKELLHQRQVVQDKIQCRRDKLAKLEKGAAK